MLFGCYRRGDANDPDTYVAAMAAVLACYDAELIREVTDPRTGIQTSEKFMSFMPNAGELKFYCEGIAARRARIQRLGSFQKQDWKALAPPPPQPGDLANVFVPAENKRYPQLLEWSKTADKRLFKFEARPGIWVSHDTWDQRQMAVRKRPDEPPRTMQLSEAALKVMGLVDAERYGHTAADEQAAE